MEKNANMYTRVAAAIIVAAAIVVAAYIWSSYNRYDIVVGDGIIAYEVDRKTGKTWYIRGDRKNPHSK